MSPCSSWVRVPEPGRMIEVIPVHECTPIKLGSSKEYQVSTASIEYWILTFQALESITMKCMEKGTVRRTWRAATRIKHDYRIWKGWPRVVPTLTLASIQPRNLLVFRSFFFIIYASYSLFWYSFQYEFLQVQAKDTPRHCAWSPGCCESARKRCPRRFKEEGMLIFEQWSSICVPFSSQPSHYCS